MILVGYIKPYNEYSFSIPVYSLGDDYYFHTLTDDLKIKDFSIFEITKKEYIRIKINLEVNIGEYGIIVFVGEKFTPLITYANQIVPQICTSYRNKIFEKPNLFEELNSINGKVSNEDINSFLLENKYNKQVGKSNSFKIGVYLNARIQYKKLSSKMFSKSYSDDSCTTLLINIGLKDGIDRVWLRNLVKSRVSGILISEIVVGKTSSSIKVKSGYANDLISALAKISYKNRRIETIVNNKITNNDIEEKSSTKWSQRINRRKNRRRSEGKIISIKQLTKLSKKV